MAQRPITLRAGAWLAVVAPEAGGALMALDHAGAPVLRRAPDREMGNVRRAASFPMVPFANRIDGGVLPWRGTTYVLPRDPVDPRHALHGVGWRAPWSLEWAITDSASLVLDHAANDEWPFAFRARQAFSLSTEGLCVTLSMTNTGPAEAPAGIGLHPYFAAGPQARVRLKCEGAWTNGEDGLPAKREAALARFLATGYALGGGPLDHDVYGWDGEAELVSPGQATARLKADPVFSHLRVYIVPGGSECCALEPVSHMANAVHRQDEDDHGLVALAPGATLQGRVWFSVVAS